MNDHYNVIAWWCNYQLQLCDNEMALCDNGIIINEDMNCDKINISCE